MAGLAKYIHIDKEHKPATSSAQSDSIYIRNKIRSEASLSNVRKIYKYLNGNGSGLNDFCEMLKRKYPDAHITIGGRSKWDFGTDAIMKEFWEIERFIPKLEAEGLDDFSRLQYWANKLAP